MDTAHLILIIVIYTTIFSTFVLSVIHYVRYRINEQLYIVIAFFLLLFSILHKITGYIDYLHLQFDTKLLIVQVSTLLTLVSFTLLFKGIISLGGYEFSNIDRGLILLGYFNTGILITQLEKIMNKPDLEFNLREFLFLFFYVVCIIYIISRITGLLFRSYFYSDSSTKEPYKYLLTSWSIILISSLAVGFEMKFVSKIPIISITLASIGFLIFAIIYLKYPLIIDGKSLGLIYMLISDMETGTPVYSYTNYLKRFQYSDSLYAGWLRGILNIFDEIIGEKEELSSIQFKDGEILIQTRSKLIGYIYVRKDSPVIRKLMDQMLSNLYEKTMIDDENTKDLMDSKIGSLVL